MVSYQFHTICYELLSQKSRDQKVRALFRDEPRKAGLCPEGLSRSRHVRSPEIPGVSCDRHGQAGRRQAHRGDIPVPGCWGRSVPEMEHGELQLPTMQVPACMLRLRREPPFDTLREPQATSETGAAPLLRQGQRLQTNSGHCHCS